MHTLYHWFYNTYFTIIYIFLKIVLQNSIKIKHSRYTQVMIKQRTDLNISKPVNFVFTLGIFSCNKRQRRHLTIIQTQTKKAKLMSISIFWTRSWVTKFWLRRYVTFITLYISAYYAYCKSQPVFQNIFARISFWSEIIDYKSRRNVYQL